MSSPDSNQDAPRRPAPPRRPDVFDFDPSDGAASTQPSADVSRVSAEPPAQPEPAPVYHAAVAPPVTPDVEANGSPLAVERGRAPEDETTPAPTRRPRWQPRVPAWRPHVPAFRVTTTGAAMLAILAVAAALRLFDVDWD